MNASLVACDRCGTVNRVAVHSSSHRPICGHCRSPLFSRPAALPPPLPTRTSATYLTRPVQQRLSKAVVPLAQEHPLERERMDWMFGFAGVTFLLGLFWPLLTIKKHVSWWIITFIDERNTVSLASGLRDLLKAGHLLLFGIIFLFSVAFPVTKLGLCSYIWYQGVSQSQKERWIHWLAVAGKWSMLDVMVVSLLVVILKLGDLVDVQVHLGVLFFAVSVILSMLITAEIGKGRRGVRP